MIGVEARDVAVREAMKHVLGFTAANDVTARQWQTRTGPPLWMRGKGFDTFCPLGPAIVTSEMVAKPDDLVVRTIVNSQSVRHGSTKDMIRSVAAIVSELSRHMTLPAGTVILTGAPPRASESSASPPLQAGDEVAVEIDGIGRLVNHVEAC